MDDWLSPFERAVGRFMGVCLCVCAAALTVSFVVMLIREGLKP